MSAVAPPDRSRLILAAASVRSLAESALRIGLEPWCFDFFGDADLQERLQRDGGRFCGTIASFDELPSRCEQLDPTIPVLCGGGIENHSHVLHALRRQRQVLNSSDESIRRARDIRSLSAGLRQQEICVPELAPANSATLPDMTRRWLLKPVNGCGGLGIRFARVGSSADSSDGILQQFIEGVPMSAVCLRHPTTGLRVIGTALQCIGWASLNATGFQYCGALGPVLLNSEIHREVQRMAAAIGEFAELTGIYGIDFVLKDGRAWLIEVNPRLTATHWLYDSEVTSVLNLHRQCFDVDHNAAPPTAVDAERVTGNHPCRFQFVCYPRHGITVSGDDFASAGCTKASLCDNDVCVRLADIPAPGISLQTGHPMCSLIGSAGSLTGVVDGLTRVAFPEFLAEHVNVREVATDMSQLLERIQTEAATK